MAARSIATLTVSFGMVSIPVKLFSATEASRAISFNLLHKACGSRLKQQYICVKEEVVVAREDMAKGYEFAKDQYVMFSPEELKALEEAGTHTADIAGFVPIESIDPGRGSRPCRSTPGRSIRSARIPRCPPCACPPPRALSAPRARTSRTGPFQTRSPSPCPRGRPGPLPLRRCTAASTAIRRSCAAG